MFFNLSEIYAERRDHELHSIQAIKLLKYYLVIWSSQIPKCLLFSYYIPSVNDSNDNRIESKLSTTGEFEYSYVIMPLFTFLPFVLTFSFYYVLYFQNYVRLDSRCEKQFSLYIYYIDRFKLIHQKPLFQNIYKKN